MDLQLLCVNYVQAFYQCSFHLFCGRDLVEVFYKPTFSYLFGRVGSCVDWPSLRGSQWEMAFCCREFRYFRNLIFLSCVWKTFRTFTSNFSGHNFDYSSLLTYNLSLARIITIVSCTIVSGSCVLVKKTLAILQGLFFGKASRKWEKSRFCFRCFLIFSGCDFLAIVYVDSSSLWFILAPTGTLDSWCYLDHRNLLRWIIRDAGD